MLVLIAGCASARRQRAGRGPRARRARAAGQGACAGAPRPPSLRRRPRPRASTRCKRGDTLYSIALEHGHDYREVAQWNSLDDPTKLSVGQVLRVKPPAQPRP